MEKIKLKDGTELEIMNGAQEGSISMKASPEQASQTKKILTDENLEEIKILNDAGLECATYTNKHCPSFECNTDAGITVFKIEDADLYSKRLNALKASQNDQDSAIEEIGSIISEG